MKNVTITLPDDLARRARVAAARRSMANVKRSYFVDTNLFVCAIDAAEREKRGRAKDFLQQISDRNLLVLSPQSLDAT
jgi:hypothetical protein